MQKGLAYLLRDLNRSSSFLIAAAFYSVHLGLVAATPGALDTNFNVGITDYGVRTVLLQPDGKVIIAGYFTQYKNTNRADVARLNPDASVDPSFNVGSVASMGTAVWCAYLYSDGKVLIAGGFSDKGRNRIARLNSDGSIDSSFDPGIGPNGDIHTLAVQPDGKIVIGGGFGMYGSDPRHGICRLNSDGTLDPSFVADVDNWVEALALQSDGKVLAAGWFNHVNGVPQPFITRLGTDGMVDTNFIPTVGAPIQCLALQQDGRILIGGYYGFSSGAPLGRLTRDGLWDSSFSIAIGTGGGVQSILLQPDDRIVFTGSFPTVNGISRTNIARIYADGTTDLSFAASPNNTVSTVAALPDNQFIIAGGFSAVEGVPEQGLARLYGDDLSGPPVVQVNGKALNAYQSDSSVEVPVFRAGNTNISTSVQYVTSDLEAQAGVDYVGGSGALTFAPGEVLKNVPIGLMNDGEMDNSERFSFTVTNVTGGTLGPISNTVVTIIGVNSQIQITTPDIATNEMAGTLSCSLTRVVTNVASSVLCQTVTGSAVPGVQFVNLSQRVTFAPGQTITNIFFTIIDNDQPGPDTSFSIQLSDPVGATIGARSNLTISITENDGLGHPAPGVVGSVNAIRSTADGGIILGGSFVSANGKPRRRLAKIFPDGTVDTSFDTSTGFDASVSGLLVQSNGSMIVGGAFSSFDGTGRSRVAKLNSDGTLYQAFDSGGAVDNAVRVIAPTSDGGYYIAGTFTSYAGTALPGIGKINGDGSLNTNFVPQIPQVFPPMNVLCLATQATGGLVVGADSGVIPFLFNTNVLFRLQPDGSRDLTFSNLPVSAFSVSRVNAILIQPDGKIIIGGQFSNVGIARLTPNGGPDATFNPSGGVSVSSIARLLPLTNGQIMVVGSFTSYGGMSRKNICRINSSGSIDPVFDAGTGSDGVINDICSLPDGRLAIGGTFRKFGGFPRYGFAILTPNGALVTNIKIEHFSSGSDLQFGLDVEPDRTFYIQQSTDLANWQVVHSNFLHVPFTNISILQLLSDRAYFRIQQ